MYLNLFKIKTKKNGKLILSLRNLKKIKSLYLYVFLREFIFKLNIYLIKTKLFKNLLDII